ncbi:hypothetical protein BEWA_030100 [Theileria equi strain WA]|uniref:Uncharacterized protein n=1 Tax=Theileria equi strain WA TaxID=1537102 RepID=L0AY16_THEEQ|nr:hypothetical protein BEWA_030100 [Theileria equi strain WA]AFZ80158.1 hypothetical protein BEWA_030100 [Theileria equi strain WA]|eukprot:XP_004829824.1 hypothetical protein BEWA_030100 [Theileria equi strain WA]
MSANVNIKSKCPIGNKVNGTCHDDPRITAKKGTVSGARSYGYCTHNKPLSTFIRDLNYNRKSLQIENGGPPKPLTGTHSMIWETVTYYHEQYGSNGNDITKPLLLGIKFSSWAQHDWYENTGNSIKWKKVDDPTHFPTDNNIPVSPEFKGKLDGLACSLHNLHKIDIHNQRNSYTCSVCSKAKIGFKIDRFPQVPYGYTGFEYTLQDLENSITHPVVYGGTTIRYSDDRAHYQDFKISHEGNYESITVYYWEGEGVRENPLIIEVKTTGHVTFWFENTGDKITWVNITGTPGFPSTNVDHTNSQFKDKLDVLSCKLGGIVEIDLSKHADEEYCHNDGTHTKRIKVALNPNIFGFPNYLTFVHTQKRGNELTIGGFKIGDTPQTGFSGLQSPIKASKITVFLPTCDHNNPFLFHIESKDGNNGKWFKRTAGGNNWEEHSGLTGQTPEGANDYVKQAFSELTKGLTVTPCKAPPSVIQLDINKRPADRHTETVYLSGGIPIHVKKAATSTNGFFKLVHSTAKTPFKLGLNVARDQTIKKTKSPGTPILDVQEVAVYFWTLNHNLPILLGVTTTEEKYYSYGSTTGNIGHGSWINFSFYASKPSTYLLDDQNCQRNHAVPFDLKIPTDPSILYTNTQAPVCVQTTRRITESDSQLTQDPPNSNYTTKAYNMKPHTKISRVTHKGDDTTGINLKDEKISKVRVHSYPGDLDGNDTPLMLQFMKHDGDSEWFESTNKDGTQWAPVTGNTGGFYSSEQPTENLTNKLDSIACSIGIGVTMNLSLDNSMRHVNGTKYCCDSSSVAEMKVTVTDKPDSLNEMPITCYKHEIGGGDSLAGIKYYENGDATKRKNITAAGLYFPISGSLSVYTFYCKDKDPVLIYIEGGKPGVNKWFKKSDDGNKPWVRLSNELPNEIPDNFKECDKKTKLLEQLGKLGCPNSWHCSQNSSGTTMVGISYNNSIPHDPNNSAVSGQGGAGRNQANDTKGDTWSWFSDIFQTTFDSLLKSQKNTKKTTETPENSKTQTAPDDQSHGSTRQLGSSEKSTTEQNYEEASDKRGPGQPVPRESESGTSSLPPEAKPPPPGTGPAAPAEEVGKADTDIQESTGGGSGGSQTDGTTPPEPTIPGATPHEGRIEAQVSSQPSAQLSDSAQEAEPQLPQAVSGLEVVGGAVGLGSIVSSVFGGAGGLTGFGWWIYKRSKGDPLVLGTYPANLYLWFTYIPKLLPLKLHQKSGLWKSFPKSSIHRKRP